MITLTSLFGMEDVKTSSTPNVIKRKKNNIVPWVDKYRPKKLSEIIFQDEIVDVLKDTIKTGEMTHLLFYGPPGTGKTSTILSMAYELFGPNNCKNRIIELNASDERGIGVVRNKIMTFAKSSLCNGDKDYPSPAFKIIILDEADTMTTEAQSALRKMIEVKTNITRFCFICNYINQIIEPIASRCVKYRFKPIEKNKMCDKIKDIVKKENINISSDNIELLYNISDGDLRKAIMLLQNLKYSGNPIINKEYIYEISGHAPDSVIENIFYTCTTKNIIDIYEINNVIRSNGWIINNILTKLLMFVIKSDLSDIKKKQICKKIASSERMLIDGADEYIQLFNVLVNIHITNLN